MAEIQDRRFVPDSYRVGWLNRGWDFGVPSRGREAVFGKAINFERVPNQVVNGYAVLATRTGLSSYRAGPAQAWNVWTDSQNNEILLESQTEYVLQAFTGISPKPLRDWPAYPSGSARGQLDEIQVVEPPTIETGSYWDGITSPFINPSKRTEMLIPPNLHVRHMIFNPLRKAVMPQFLLQMRRYLVRWYNPNDKDDWNCIKGFADFIFNNNPRRPVHYWTPGNAPYTWSSQENIQVPSVDIELLADALRAGRDPPTFKAFRGVAAREVA